MFSRILAVLFFVAAASAAGANVGSNKCTWGPSYWCSGANAANECGALSYCQSKGMLMDVTVDSAAPSPGECKICKMVVGAVVEKVGSNATEQKVEQVLDSICEKLGGFKGPCETFVAKYTPELMAIIVDDMNETSICQKLGLCPKADGTYITTSPVECKLCELVIGKVVANLTSNSTEQEIEDALDKVCNKMGGLSAVCTDLVEKYTPELIQILAQDLNATSVCQKIGMCPNSTATLTLFAAPAAPIAKPNPGECKLCMFVIGQIDSKIDENSTTEEIEAALDKVCGKLGAFTKICDDLVTKYAPELVATLINDLNATRVCKKIGVCGNTTTAAVSAVESAAPIPVAVSDTLELAGAVGALGTQACTDGPSYWCSSKAAAAQCSAIAHCEATVWAEFGAPQ